MTCRRCPVLLVDNDWAIRDALCFALRLEGFRIRAHRTGGELLADPGLPNASCLVISDRLEEMNGFQVLEQIRARRIPLPAILLTSGGTRVLMARARAMGVTKVLEKPLLNNVLIANLQTILSGGTEMNASVVAVPGAR